MFLLLRNTFLGVLCLLGMHLAAQNVSISTLPATQLPTCGAPGTFRVVVHNLTGATLTGISIVPEMPAGVQYVPGSVSGGFTEANISQLDSVTFNGVNLLPGQRDTIFWQARAVCNAVPGAVIDRINVYHSQGLDVNFSTPYQILRPSLSIQSISNASYTGAIGSQFQRCVTVVNGGFGPLSQLSLNVNSDPASLQTTNFTLFANGTPLVPTVVGSNLTVQLGPTHIQQVGDGDTLLEQNESMTICFNVRILECTQLNSTITASWGCGGSTCESQSSTANVTVPTLVPNITTTRTFTENRCYGNGAPSIIRIALFNAGSGPARNVDVDVWQGEPSGPSNGYISRLDTNNMVLRSSISGVSQIAAFSVESQNASTGNYACLGNPPLRRVRVRIPLLRPGERDTLVIEQYACCKTWCASGPTEVSRSFYQVDYQDQCLSNSYLIPAVNITGHNFGRVLSFTNAGLTDIPQGDTALYTVEHSDFRFFNINPGAYAWVDLVAPPGLIILSTPGSVFFRDVQGDLWNPTSIIRNGDTVRAFFNLNPPAVFALEKAELVFRATNDCSTGPCSSGPKLVQYTLYQKADPTCGCDIVIGCHSFTINTHCGICPATCTNGGMIFMSFDAYRENYGLPDNDNNGLPDASGSIDRTRVRTQHLMLRDTLYTRFLGVVQNTAANPTWSEAFASSTITRGNALTPVSYSARIYDASTGLQYTCPLAAPTVTNVGGNTRRFRYNLNVAALAASLPPGFVYEVNDSVEVVARYVFSANPGSIVEAQTITNQFATQTAGGALVAGCDNYSGAFVLVGYYYTSWGPDEVQATGCANITISENYYLSIGNCCNNYAGGNIFDFEYRHWGIPGIGRFIVPTGYTYVSSTMNYVRTAGTIATNSTTLPITPSSINGDTINFNMANMFTSNGGTFVLSDDGYHGTINVVLRPTCLVTPDVKRPIRYTWLFNPITGLTGTGSVAANASRIDTVSYEAATLSINPVLPTASGLGANVSWDVTIENNSNLAAANNAWFALVSPSGLITPTSVVRLPTNTPVSPVGGIYQFGTLLQDSSRTFRITASYSNCAEDSLRVVAGWDCIGYPASLASYPCQTASEWLYIEPQPAVLQATMNLDPGPFEVCDSMEVEVNVVSAQISSVRDIQVQVTLPLSGGLTYGAGSAELRYPDLAPYGAVGNPTIAGNQLTWQINNISPVIATRNLPGIINPDSNRFTLRFTLYTDCNLISGDRLRVRVSGLQGCNSPVTPVLLLSNPININGVVQPYATQVAAQATGNTTCPETKAITLNIVNSGALLSTLGDSVFVSFGPGFSYAGGFVGQLNPPSNATPRVISGAAGLGLVWDMPTGLAAGDTMRFTFNVLVGDAAPCGADLATVQTITNQGLFCARTGNNCITSLQTGSTVLNLNVSRPDLNFFGFSSTIQPIAGGNDFDYSGSIQNTGLPVAAGTSTEVRFYCDGDNSGGYSPGDALLGNYSTTAGIPTGGSHAFSGSILIPSASCPLSSMVYALITPNSAAGFCLCDTAFANTNAVLPVEWVQVDAEPLAQSNRVYWEATLSQDHDHFVVEKLIDTDWRAISDPIRARQSAYQWLDQAPAATERYRIRATDQNGAVAHSRQVEVVRDMAVMGIQVYPNPATKLVTLEAPAGTRYTLVSALGMVLRKGEIDASGLRALDIADLAAGVYLLEFRQNGRQTSQRLVVE
jgi:uncharacterized repeat protein (TIGR01451 family)